MNNSKLNVKTSYLKHSSNYRDKLKLTIQRADLQAKYIYDLIGIVVTQKSKISKLKNHQEISINDSPKRFPLIGLGFQKPITPESSSRCIAPLPSISPTFQKSGFSKLTKNNELHQQYISGDNLIPDFRAQSTSPNMKKKNKIHQKLNETESSLKYLEISPKRLKRREENIESASKLSKLELQIPIMQSTLSEKHMSFHKKRDFSPIKLRRLL